MMMMMMMMIHQAGKYCMHSSTEGAFASAIIHEEIDGMHEWVNLEFMVEREASDSPPRHPCALNEYCSASMQEPCAMK
jgi:hypothetical protein